MFGLSMSNLYGLIGCKPNCRQQTWVGLGLAASEDRCFAGAGAGVGRVACKDRCYAGGETYMSGQREVKDYM